MKSQTLLLLAAAVLPWSARAADKFTVTVTHDLAAARPAETIVLPFSEVRQRIPDVLIDHVVVRDAKGRIVPAQVTNFTPDVRPAKYDDLIFQHDFAAGEKSATFTVEKTSDPVPPFPARAFARYVPERLDDFAWENDKVGHRMYGPGLDTPAAGKSRMISSGIDVWAKRVSYPIVDRWYLKGHDAYHVDTGEGVDLYEVGTARGAGGLGVWDGKNLSVSHNYKTWKVLANGPLRAVFELTYDTWDAGGVKVSEVKRFTVDAGHQLDCIESTFTIDGAGEVPIAIGISKHKTNGAVTKDQKAGLLAYWEQYPKEGQLGTAVVLTAGACTGFAENSADHLILTKAAAGKTLRYYAGAGWDRAGEITSKEAWNQYLEAFAARLNSPVRVKCSD